MSGCVEEWVSRRDGIRVGVSSEGKGRGEEARTDKQTDRQTDRQTYIHTVKQVLLYYEWWWMWMLMSDVGTFTGIELSRRE